MPSGTIIYENALHVSTAEAEFDELGPAGPTGRKVQRKIVRFFDPTGLIVEVRVVPEDWDAFVQAVSGRNLIVPTNGVARVGG